MLKTQRSECCMYMETTHTQSRCGGPGTGEALCLEGLSPDGTPYAAWIQTLPGPWSEHPALAGGYSAVAS